MDPIFSQQFNYAQPKPKGGMFGGDGKFGIGQAIVAALNGYLAGTGNPVGTANIQMMQQMMQAKRQRQQELDDYNRQRGDQNADFMTHRQYEIDNPLPKQPGEFDEALAATGVIPGTPEYAAAMKQRVGNMLDPVVMTPQGPMLRSQVVGALAPTPAPPGVTFTPIPGGPTPGASGGFPY
jgi:hypothetical protein